MRQSLFFALSRFVSKTMLHGSVKTWNRDEGCRPAIYAANHPSTLDPFFVIGALPQPAHIMISEYMFRMPILGFILKQAGHIKVLDGKGRSAYETARRYLQEGKSILIFSEGIVSENPLRIGPIRTGTVRLAMETGVPVIPLGISLNPEKLKKSTVRIGAHTETGCWYSNGMYGISFGRTVYFSGDLNDRDGVKKKCLDLESIMRNQMEECSWLMKQRHLKRVYTYNILSLLIYFIRMHFAYANWVNS